MDDESSVHVAVRIRPQLPREKIDMCRVCTSVTPDEPQITLGKDKAFTYDYVFDMDSTQDDIYSMCAETLVTGSLEGYNATVLAYGQTGSGKTYTMGTGFDVNIPSEQKGIIPRAIDQIFQGIQRLTDTAVQTGQTPPQFKVSAQFLELYNDEVIDLFDPNLDYSSGKGKSGIKIHQDSNNCIYVTGVTSERVNSSVEAMQLLKQGALSRTTASTQMNAQSSRSHAIFTLHIIQQRLVKLDEMDGDENDGEKGQEFETLTAKFHFVDLAGSERLKRTGATGDRAKEGISINCGLLALGNVISALGDVSKKALHVPYRDSKLTRLLQDSLGGNSRTLMIACISPSDQDFMETLNTLKYANRARNIQNKVVINQDKSSRTIALLKKEIQELRLELLEYKQGKRIMNSDGTETVNDMFHENTLLQNENDNLRTRVKGMQETIDNLSVKIAEVLTEKASSSWINGNTADGGEMKDMIKSYLIEIESLRAQLLESESICAQLRKSLSRKTALSPRHDSFSDPNIDSILDLAKRDVEKDLEMAARSQVMQESNQSDQSDSESESETTEENEVVNEQYSSELAILNSEISVKQRLIEELEKAQRKLVNMKMHYEDKLVQLEARIHATQEERDTVLASYGESKQSTEKVKKIKDEYEKKIQGLQREMKDLQAAKKEHAKLLRNQSQYQNQLRTLNNEVSDMKRTKVKLMNKMREEAQKHKEETVQTNRKIAQLMKKSRQDANLIRNLEAEKRLKSAVLKRKQEEVTALKRAANTRLRTLNNNNNITKYTKSPKAAKQRWVNLEKNISQNAMLRESIASLEKQMEREMESRTELQEELRNKMIQMNEERFENSSVLREEVDSLRASLEHVQNTITDLQDEIIQVEENKTVLETGEVLQGVQSIVDASYIVDKLYHFTLHHSYMSAQKEVEKRALLAKLELLERENRTQTELLKHMLEKGHSPLNVGRTSPVNHVDSNTSSRSTSPTDNNHIILPKTTGVRPRKKLTMTPDELLYTVPPQGSITTLPSPELMQPPPLTRSFTTVKVASVPSSPAIGRKGLTLSPRANRKPFILTNHPSMERLDKSPPGSPPVYRRQTSRESREENVFSRLTQHQAMNNSNRLPGKITAHIPKKIGKTPLICTHTAEGHSRAVLALCATDDVLFSASQDRNVIQWDLNEMREVNIFGNHPNNVVSVKYDPSRRLMYSVSNSFVKIWDTRDSKCVKTLTSSGLTANFSSNNFNTSEPQINDIALNTKNLVLYSAAGDKVRIWDLRKFSVVGKLTGGHQAAIMCIAATKGPNHSDVVFTGSKDHYIKVFDVPLGTLTGSLTPRVTLEPPHYDGIQCLVACGSSLFSGSRDCIIKKWNNDELVTSVNLAHKDWVTGLCMFQGSSVLASSCRDGTVKLWSTDSCNLLGELKAHSSPINAITSNSNFLFTASSKEIGIWKPAAALPAAQDIMTMSTGHIFQLSV